MILMNSKSKKYVIFGILVLSIFLGVRISGFTTKRTVREAVDTKEAEQLFKSAQHGTKTVLDFSVADFAEAREQFNEIVAEEGVNTVYHIGSRQSIVTLFEVSDNSFNDVINRIRSIPGLRNERKETSPIASSVVLDIDTHIEQSNELLNRYRERLNNQYLTTREISELHREIRNVQTKIDSLNALKKDKGMENNLVFAVFSGITETTSGTVVGRYISLIAYTILSFFLVTIFFIMIYLGVELLNHLIVVLGIKTAKHGARYGAYGSYGSREGSYGYSYMRKAIRKRKKKSADEKNGDEEKKAETDQEKGDR